jgi:hypothetical protein
MPVMLASLVDRMARMYKPDPFRAQSTRPPVTLADLLHASRWSELVSEYRLPAGSGPLALAQLRFSRVFPEMFVHRQAGGTRVLTLSEAVDVVRAAARAHGIPTQAARPVGSST